MKKFFFLLMLMFGLFVLTPQDVIAASKKEVQTLNKNISDVSHLLKFQAVMPDLMVWDYHQKTTDFCQTKCPF